ncbi:PAS domain-containing sensor histidine kinase [Methanococcoides sp. SA1]|nr:PAS domain-containing sensor histidine kinase [Methanococcoides sp. SA1]
MSDGDGDRFRDDGGFVGSVTHYLSRFVEMKLVENDLNIFKSISYKANYGISVLDMDGNIIYVNEAFSQLHGYSADELLDNNFLMFYNEGQIPHLKRLFEKLLSSDDCEGEDAWHMRKDGSIFPAILECNLILDGDNAPSYIFVALRDVTVSKKAEDALKRAMSIADAANCSKSEFLANVSHELRTPLNSIVGFSEILLDGRCGDLNDVQRRYVQNVSNNGNHLSEIINEILEISKIEAGKAEVNLEEFCILPSVLEVKESLMHSILLKNISFVCDVNPKIHPIRVDKTKFKHILHNLLTNAVKFTSDHGSVGIHASAISDMMHIVIFDDGIGIPREQLPHLYDKFYQVDGSTKRKYGGTGLGLALTKKLVTLNGGQMWVESEVNVGTKVHVMLPLA